MGIIVAEGMQDTDLGVGVMTVDIEDVLNDG